MQNMISVFDRGFLYGDGLFETMRSYNGKVFKLDEHLSRLVSSANIVKIKIPLSKIMLKEAIYKNLKAKRLKDAYIRLTVTRGEGAFSLKPSAPAKPKIIIIVKKYEPNPERFYSRGISAKISDIRQNEHSPLSGIKSLNFLNYVLARMRAQDEGFNEAILMNTKGHIAEAATSNIFLVKNGKLITPSLDSGILPGITRRAVIGIAKELGIGVSERPVFPKDLIHSNEVFLTNSMSEILPVVKIGRAVIGKGLPGDITKLLHSAYKNAILLT